MIDVTRLACRENVWTRPGRHSLTPRGGQHNRHLVCEFCGHTERWLRAAAERGEHP